MDPLTLGLLAGGTSLVGNMMNGFGQQSEIQKRNKRLEAEKNRVSAEYGAEKERLTQGQKSLATDFLTNYITIRDKDRADGLRGEYGRSQSEFSTALSRMLSEKNQLLSGLEMQKQDAPSTGSIIGQSVASGFGAGMQGYGAGLQMDALKGLNNTTGGIGSESNIGQSFSNQINVSNSVADLGRSAASDYLSDNNVFNKMNANLIGSSIGQSTSIGDWYKGLSNSNDPDKKRLLKANW